MTPLLQDHLDPRGCSSVTPTVGGSSRPVFTITHSHPAFILPSPRDAVLMNGPKYTKE